MLDQMAVSLRASVAQTFADDDIDIQVEPRLVASQSAPVCIDIFPGDPARTTNPAAFGDIAGHYVLTVRVRCASNDEEEAQDILIDMLDDYSDLSLAGALEAMGTLGGYASEVTVDPDGISGVQEFQGTPNPLIGCTWRVLVGVLTS